MARNWYPFYVGDYARKTAHLSLLEHGAYRLLLDHYYATGMPIPNDPIKLYRICRARTPSERQAVVSVAAEFFTQDGTLMRQKKCDSELAKALEFSKTQSAKARIRHSHNPPGDKPAGARPTTTTTSSEGKPSSECLGLPDWMPVPEWNEFVKMRKQMSRGAFTEKAKNLAISKLNDLRIEGYDPIIVINNTILNSWKTFYPPKEASNDQHHKTQRNKPTSTNAALAALFAAGNRSGGNEPMEPSAGSYEAEQPGARGIGGRGSTIEGAIVSREP